MSKSNRWYNATEVTTRKYWTAKLLPSGLVLLWSGTTSRTLTAEKCRELFTLHGVATGQHLVSTRYAGWVKRTAAKVSHNYFSGDPSTWSDQQNLDHYILTTSARE